MRLCPGIGACFVIVAGLGVAAEDRAARVIATVNDDEITQADLDAEYLVRRIPPDKQGGLRAAVVNDLIDRRLIAAFLDSRKAPIPEPELNAQVALLKRAVEAGEGSLDDVLAKLGLTEESLRAHLALPLRWQAFVRRTVTDQELRDYFEAHRAEFDGTRIRVRQIVISVPADADEAAWSAAQARLDEVRRSIMDGTLSFEDAARQHSTSPSGKRGGDVGWIGFHGRLPPVLAAAAFALNGAELSAVLRSPLGVHLLQVTDRKPGEYSLEDVRDEVWQQKTREYWTQQAAEARKSARIRIMTAE